MDELTRKRKTPIGELLLCKRANDAAKFLGVKTAGGLANKTEQCLLRIFGVGATTIWDIRNALGHLGLTLKSDRALQAAGKSLRFERPPTYLGRKKAFPATVVERHL